MDPKCFENHVPPRCLLDSNVRKICKVVIVDDHPVFLTVLGELLQNNLEFSVVGRARNGEEGLEVCARTQPDLVLLDMMMPGMSGLELIAGLRRQLPKVLLLAVSGLMTKELIHMAIAAGANGYFSKSRSIEELFQTLRALVDGNAEMTPDEAGALRWAVRERQMHKAISANDLRLLRLYSDDLPIKQIALETGRTASSVYKALKRIRQQLNVKTDWDLRLAAKRFGLAGYKETQE
jgi:DNA-binding NarL/FixJ family response regulator